MEITPVIKFSDDKVCRLEIVKSQKDIPFKVRICLQLGSGWGCFVSDVDKKKLKFSYDFKETCDLMQENHFPLKLLLLSLGLWSFKQKSSWNRNPQSVKKLNFPLRVLQNKKRSTLQLTLSTTHLAKPHALPFNSLFNQIIFVRRSSSTTILAFWRQSALWTVKSERITSLRSSR